ncbi:hypothetical protein [Nostoc sp. TCL240-02]|nr:hypothetical protein [Nostoc sp. TCL240-02]
MTLILWFPARSQRSLPTLISLPLIKLKRKNYPPGTIVWIRQ